MRIIRWFLIAAIASGFVAFLSYTYSLRSGPPDAGNQASVPPPSDPNASDVSKGSKGPGEAKVPAEGFTVSADCKSCHETIYDEWSKDEHANSFSEDVYASLTAKYTMVECFTCHAPEPMLEAGLKEVAKTREKNRMDGTDCLSCHLKGGKARGFRGLDAACAGEKVPELNTSMACFPCHSTHNLFKEYEESSYAKQGKTCQDCHMEKVTRPIATGGPPRETRKHRFLGGHDIGMLRKAVTLDLKTEGEDLVMVVTNVGSAHGVPGEINNRILQCEASVVDAKGDETNLIRVQFQAPPRLLRNKIPSTQLMPGEPRRLRFPLGTPKGKITVKLLYKLEMYVLDAEATVVMEKSIDF